MTQSIEFLACDNIMSDRVLKEDGSYSTWNMGGPAFFALSGIRLWTENVKLVSRTGADFENTYAKWMKDNRVTMESVRYELENVTSYSLSYHKSGVFDAKPTYSLEHLGYLKTTPEDIDRASEGYNIKGIYLAQNTDKVFWEKLYKVKLKHGFKIMWEAEYAPKYEGISKEKFYKDVLEILPLVDCWSLNNNEASDLFGVEPDKDEEIIAILQKLPIEMTFYRVGKRGSYTITKDNAYFCPSVNPWEHASVDPTGCGNNSTAAAMYAYISQNDPKMVSIMANISSGFNVCQFGPYPKYTDEDQKYARNLAEKIYLELS